jgi:hypothetical protein
MTAKKNAATKILGCAVQQIVSMFILYSLDGIRSNINST